MVNIEIDGIPLTVDSTKMIIQAADEAGIDIPRFCYHKKLSIAANCRMCLIEVEQSRKALPACATPVAEGMKVFTHSKVAVDAQRGVMEFLLINHPLDCPICDQGGECELQDMSMGYGSGVGRFTEGKRVVKDKDIGPLINTDMTRCIHCTRCVRFGQEIAGITELGATGRGEHMEIGTYIEHSLTSEMSGNIIDLCPVGALTSKPFRYLARAWELTAHPSIAPHDAVGSNIEFHTRRNEVLRVVPRDNESINETWLSDRDRFSYLGLNHEQRATEPMIKQNGEWQTVDWQTALQAAVDGLKVIKTRHGTEQIAGLISPTATLEEAYLFQRLLRGLGTDNIDHRLRQQDFADQDIDYSYEDWCLATIEQNDEIVLIGCNIRAEQPIIAHRMRQAAMMGTTITNINFFESDLLMPATPVIVNTKRLLTTLSGVAKAVISLASDDDKAWIYLLEDIVPTALEQTIAMQLSNAMRATLFIGELANNHPQASKIKALADLIARLTKSQMIVLPTANSSAAKIAGVLPYEHSTKHKAESTGLDAQQMWQQCLRSYVLFGIEPELDCADPAGAQHALHDASFVVSMNSYVTDTMLAYADVILPIASFAETSGTFIGADSQWQSFTGAVTAQGESRPGWKVLRVLGNLAKVDGFDYVSSQDIRDDVRDQLKLVFSAVKQTYLPDELDSDVELMAISEVPMYQIDSVVRRSKALQQTPENAKAVIVRMNIREADKHGVDQAETVMVSQGDNSVTMVFEIDNGIADGCIYLATGIEETSSLGTAFSNVTVEAKS
ncbi:MAG: NADH-quinone oxidoreductase subunit G [Gammaproteobacteria bacterium]|nr:MAG: NADH-quinone oxidoreductase subunit G [Gammaproteobacteria bacterium]RLA02279.1 MAG: NADH-quinone oxidoreductase subunit G [Gammaproteobacteria bacterium]